MQVDKSYNIIQDFNVLENQLIDFVENNKLTSAIDTLKKLHSSDSTLLLERLPQEIREIILDNLDIDFLKQIILWFPSYIIQDLISIKDTKFFIDFLNDLQNEDVSYLIIKHLEPQDKNYVLNAISIENKISIEKKLSYPKDSAGRLMHSSFVVAFENWSVDETLDYLKKNNNNINHHNIYDIFIVNESKQVISSVSLKSLLLAKPNQNILQLQNIDFKCVNVILDQESVALLFRNKGLSSLAVVDDSNTILGVILVDDIIDVVYSESQEDFLLTSGVNAHYHKKDNSLFHNAFLRLKWLFVNFIEALTIPFIVLLFKNTIEKYVIVAAIVQFVVALGGNSGGQSLSITIRALALNLISGNNVKSQIFKELSISFINGILLGIIGFAWGCFFGHGIIIGIITFIAVWINIVMGSAFGTLFPMIFKKLNIDPAVASSICVTTATDICGFFLVLLIASFLL